MLLPTVANVVGNRCLLGYVVHDKFLRIVPSYDTGFLITDKNMGPIQSLLTNCSNCHRPILPHPRNLYRPFTHPSAMSSPYPLSFIPSDWLVQRYGSDAIGSFSVQNS
ncbi:hypothetical protein DEO72_LG7g2602 [Vigna unguiculata]|uniref:Uncharacterized protein n=1 Tax=Vigna unguiculata TaxID=3917 RepID=A0A4D6MIN1_VIGUN|nr:hypothetical protein DEO72_LG7g2602 [Vigna unguiculata]